jgi:hypothetical protein
MRHEADTSGMGTSGMNCLRFEKELPESLEGARTPEQQAHLNSCPACSNLLADLDFIAAKASSLRDLQEPSPRVWNSLEAQLRREGLIRQPARPTLLNPFLRWRNVWVPVAAALLFIAGIKLYQPTKAGDNQPIAKQAVTIRPAQAAVSAEDSEMMKTVASRPPAQVAAYRNDLDQANAFIRDAQESLKSDPSDLYSQQLLMDAYEQKQMLYHLAMDQNDGER